MLRRKLAVALVAISVPAACDRGDPGRSGLVGDWDATGANAEGSSFVFREDGSARWLLPDPFYCIFDMEGDDTMRLDCEPGVATERGAGIRPDEFGGEQTQTFARRRGGGS